eukprot:6201280-Pleurochrysis_carterae.AAC.15
MVLLSTQGRRVQRAKRRCGWTLPCSIMKRYLASFESAIVVELVGGDPLGLANENVLGTLDEVERFARHFALELLNASCAPLSFVRAAVDVLWVLGRR